MITDIDKIWYWFVNINGIGRKTRSRLLDIFDSPQNIFEANEKNIFKIPFLDKSKKEEIIRSREKDYTKELESIILKGIKFIHVESDSYPEKLFNIPDKPHALYIKSNNKIYFDKPSVAVVGSRKCSKYGYETAYKIGYELGLNGVSVVSGMASGIDSAAHCGCVDAGGHSIAVLGCGVDVCYPKHNIDLYMNLQKNGMIISEYSIMTQPKPGLFPERNRIISGLGDVTVVVEAGEKSGTFITVDTALEQGKEVFAVPGRISDIQSKGCNNLISQGAYMFQDVCELISYVKDMYPDFVNNNMIQNDYSEELISSENKRVYEYLKIVPKHLDQIINELNISLEKAIEIIFEMELKGIVKHCGNNFFITCSNKKYN